MTYPHLKIEQECSCSSCVQGKIHRHPFPKARVKDKYAPGECVHMDLAGPFLPTYSGYTYRAMYIDDESDHVTVALLNKKSEQDSFLEKYRTMVQTQLGVVIKREHSDRGGEYTKCGSQGSV